MRESKAKYFQQAREHFHINPARTFACGDEHKDYLSALAAGAHPLVVWRVRGLSTPRQKIRHSTGADRLYPEEMCQSETHARYCLTIYSFASNLYGENVSIFIGRSELFLYRLRVYLSGASSKLILGFFEPRCMNKSHAIGKRKIR